MDGADSSENEGIEDAVVPDAVLELTTADAAAAPALGTGLARQRVLDVAAALSGPIIPSVGRFDQMNAGILGFDASQIAVPGIDVSILAGLDSTLAARRFVAPDALKSINALALSRVQAVKVPTAFDILKSFAPFSDLTAKLQSSAGLTFVNAMKIDATQNLRRMSEQISTFASGIARGLYDNREQIQQILKTAAAMSGQLAERYVQEDEVSRLSEEFLATHQWPLPSSLPLALRLHLVRETATMSPIEVENDLLSTCGPSSRALEAVWQRLAESEIMETRRHILAEARDSYLQGKYHSVIYTLLPQIEGAMVDAAFGDGDHPAWRRPEKAAKHLVSDVGNHRTQGIAPSLFHGIILVANAAGIRTRSALFAKYRASDYTFAGEPEGINRHAILHGDARRFGTEANALWILLVLAKVVEHIEATSMYVQIVEADRLVTAG